MAQRALDATPVPLALAGAAVLRVRDRNQIVQEEHGAQAELVQALRIVGAVQPAVHGVDQHRAPRRRTLHRAERATHDHPQRAGRGRTGVRQQQFEHSLRIARREEQPASAETDQRGRMAAKCAT